MKVHDPDLRGGGARVSALPHPRPLGLPFRSHFVVRCLLLGTVAVAALLVPGVLLGQGSEPPLKQHHLAQAGAPQKPASAQSQLPSPGTGTQYLSSLLASGRFTTAQLDDIWENRARLHGSLAEFASSLPEIADRYGVLYRVSQLLAYAGHYVLVRAPAKVRSEAFSLGYQIAQRAVELEPRRVEGQYWYAINLSGYAVTEGFFQVWFQASRVMQALDAAVAAEPRYFFSGPVRARGMMSFKMPVFPLSVGNRSKGLADLRRAVVQNPDVRLNRLSLAEALFVSGSPEAARREFQIVKASPEAMGTIEEAAVQARMAELERRLAL